MQLTRRTLLTSLTLTALTGAGAVTLAACGRDAGPVPAGSQPAGASGGAAAAVTGRIKGAGASSQADAQDAWMNLFLARYPDAGVEYAAEGSGRGARSCWPGRWTLPARTRP